MLPDITLTAVILGMAASAEGSEHAHKYIHACIIIIYNATNEQTLNNI